jgi:hypothetical protein
VCNYRPDNGQQFNVTKKCEKDSMGKVGKSAWYQPRKGLEGRGAFFAPSGAKNGAERNPAKPGFRREAPEMRPNFLKNLRNVKLPNSGKNSLTWIGQILYFC